MFDRFKRRGKKDADAASLLSQLEERLVGLIPPQVRSLNIREPVYSLRIWYFDGDRPPSLLLVPESARQRVLGSRGLLVPNYLWVADELFGGAHTTDINDPVVSELLRRWNTQPNSGGLVPVRKMVQQVAARLNHLSWSEYLPVTDDFVVFAADGSHEFCNDYEEMLASVPPERIELLRSRGMLGPKKWYTLSTDD